MTIDKSTIITYAIIVAMLSLWPVIAFFYSGFVAQNILSVIPILAFSLMTSLKISNEIESALVCIILTTLLLLMVPMYNKFNNTKKSQAESGFRENSVDLTSHYTGECHG